jgi:hypothetical protein
VLLATGCGGVTESGAPVSKRLRAEPVALDAVCPSRLPRFATALGKRLAIGWVEEGTPAAKDAAVELRFAQWRRGAWAEPRRVAGGERWFVNWTDFPGLAVLGERNLVGWFLQRSAEGTYDYQVMLVRSQDAGRTWSEPERLHDDPGPGEHGFVSLVPLDERSCAAVWLDGRNAQGHEGAAGGGAMALLARTVWLDGTLGPETVLDERVCDCCPTAAVLSADGSLLVAYRDRSEEELRDISLVRFANGSAPERVWDSADGWKIAGCPVNGPALVRDGEHVALVWFTLGGNGEARVLCAFSDDDGKQFAEPLRIAGERALGRVDAVFDDEGCLVVAWLEDGDPSAAWRVARVDPEAGVLDEHSVAATDPSRDSGLARLARIPGGILFAWTDLAGSPRVQVKKLAWE